MRPCILIKQGSSGFSNWITPEQNPNQCEIVWISDAAYGAKHYLSVQSFSPGGTTIKFTKHEKPQLTY